MERIEEAAAVLIPLRLERCLESKISCLLVSEIPGRENFLEMFVNMFSNDMPSLVKAIILVYMYIHIYTLEYIKNDLANICREKYVNGNLVSRVCMQGDMFFLKDDFPPPNYELSEVSSCDSCPTYPPATAEIQKEELKPIIREILRELLAERAAEEKPMLGQILKELFD
jgi:hypothetical protein